MHVYIIQVYGKGDDLKRLLALWTVWDRSWTSVAVLTRTFARTV